MDYLSYLTLKCRHPDGSGKGKPPQDYIILNSVGNVARAIPLLKGYESVACALDNDKAGREAFLAIRAAGCDAKDQSAYYREYNDLNDFLLGRKMARENKPPDGTRPVPVKESIRKSNADRR